MEIVFFFTKPEVVTGGIIRFPSVFERVSTLPSIDWNCSREREWEREKKKVFKINAFSWILKDLEKLLRVWWGSLRNWKLPSIAKNRKECRRIHVSTAKINSTLIYRSGRTFFKEGILQEWHEIINVWKNRGNFQRRLNNKLTLN